MLSVKRLLNVLFVNVLRSFRIVTIQTGNNLIPENCF